MKRKISILFLLFVFPLWLVAAGLILEISHNVCGAICDKYFNNPVVSAYRAADDEIFQRIHAAFPPPDSTHWNIPDREAFWNLNEGERLVLAEKRREIILVCDLEGIVISAYPCKVMPELDWISAQVKPGNSLEAFFPPAEWTDLLTTIRVAHSGERPSHGNCLLRPFNKSKCRGNVYGRFKV